jgi:hypothetical protein
MNKKITFLAFTIFASSIQQMNAMIDRDCGGGRDNFHDSSSSSHSDRAYAQQQLLKGLLENRYLSSSAKRDSLGFSNTGNSHLDACRDEPASGGLTIQQRTYIIDRHYDGSSYAGISEVSHRNGAWDAARTFELRVRDGDHDSSPISRLATRLLAEHDAQISKLAQEVAPRVQAAIPAPMMAMQPAVTVAQTEEAKFKIALEMIQKSKELQEYAAALAAARK